MPINWSPGSGKSADEMNNSPAEITTDFGLEATVTLICAWNDRLAILADILGVQYLYPHFTASGAFAKSGTSKPFGLMTNDGGEGALYQHAILTINYGHEGGGEENATGDVFSESLEPSAEFLTLDHTRFLWNSPDEDDDGTEKLNPAEAPGFLVTGFDYVQTRFGLNSIPNTVLTQLGKVNGGVKLAALLGVSFSAETLLFATGTPSRKLAADGSGKWDLTCRFSFRREGWNKFWRAQEEAYQSIYIKGGSVYKSYKTSSSLPLI